MYIPPDRQERRPLARSFHRMCVVTVLVATSLIASSLAHTSRAEDKSAPPSPPPKDAVVLFDGKDLFRWQKYPGGGDVTWKLVDGAMEVAGGDIITKDKFRDMKLHLEFMPPFLP